MTDYRSIFISDIHLGNSLCQANKLLDFLHGNCADTYYLVGDIIDSWCLHKVWPNEHDRIVKYFLTHTSEIIYIPGNHDAFFRSYNGYCLMGIEFKNKIIHSGVDGKQYLVIHGDKFDLLTNMESLWHPPWPNWIKRPFHFVIDRINQIEKQLTNEAKKYKVDGVICGHTHNAMDNTISGIRYLNTGSWTQHLCSAVVEHHDGKIEVVKC